METIKAIDLKPGDAVRDCFQGRLRLVVSNVDEAGRRLIYTNEGYFNLKPQEPVDVVRNTTLAEVAQHNKYL